MLPARPVAVFLALAALSAACGAQQIFRIVGPDGRVTFTDRPPQDSKATPAPVVGGPGPAQSAGTALPFELRAIAGRYPVTLYTGTQCDPCERGRGYLASRGIPFSERTITTNEDIEALTRLSGGPTLPFLTIGGQQIKGFSEIEWEQFLDAAGYPKTSQLPAAYRNPAPTPLVAAQAPARRQPQAQPRPEEQQPPPAQASQEPANNPAGIQF